MNTHVAYFTKLNYRTDIAIYSYLDDYTVNSKHLCLPSFLACSASALTSLMTRTATVGEDILIGFGIFLKSPFSKNSLETAKTSWKILKEVPSDVLSVLALPLRYIFWDLALAFCEPKLLIVDGVEYAELYREHLANNTLGTQAYYEDLSYVQGRAKSGLLMWQGPRIIPKEILDRTENDYYSRWVIKNLNRRHELRQIN